MDDQSIYYSQKISKWISSPHCQASQASKLPLKQGELQGVHQPDGQSLYQRLQQRCERQLRWSHRCARPNQSWPCHLASKWCRHRSWVAWSGRCSCWQKCSTEMQYLIWGHKYLLKWLPIWLPIWLPMVANGWQYDFSYITSLSWCIIPSRFDPHLMWLNDDFWCGSEMSTGFGKNLNPRIAQNSTKANNLLRSACLY